jgi:hypothetical protein
VPAAEDRAFDAVLPAIAGERGRSAPDALAGRTVSADPILRLPADGGGDAAGRFRGQPQAGETTDAGDGDRGDLPKTQYQSRTSGAQGVPLPIAGSGHRQTEPGVVCGHHLRADGKGVCVSGRGDGLVQPAGFVVAGVDHDGFGFLRGGATRGHGDVRAARNFNTDQGVQLTSADFLAGLEAQAVRISMDGKGRYLDNIFIERLWRSLKYEEIFLKAYRSPSEARGGIGAWLSFYNDERPHQTHGYRTPREVFTGVAHGYVDNVSTLTTYPQALQQQEKAFTDSNIKVSIVPVTPGRAGDREMGKSLS